MTFPYHIHNYLGVQLVNSYISVLSQCSVHDHWVDTV